MRVATTQLAAVVGLVVLAIVPIQALHFYLQNKESKCFTEDLPKHTTVTGTLNIAGPSAKTSQHIGGIGCPAEGAAD
ncbi:hypothetical protein H4R34_000339, partial [Dimargaris verticillata]